eukprot:333859-Pyramimonas_sp.AAC.1
MCIRDRAWNSSDRANSASSERTSNCFGWKLVWPTAVPSLKERIAPRMSCTVRCGRSGQMFSTRGQWHRAKL